jgi:quercetin dioxygenase-like cupin family protein
MTPAGRTRTSAPIFSGHVETQTAVGGEVSQDLRVSEITFKDGGRNRWHIHTTDQVLVVTEGEGLIAVEGEQRDLVAGDVALIPANTKHWHGAKPGKDMTHLSILGHAETTIVD